MPTLFGDRQDREPDVTIEVKDTFGTEIFASADELRSTFNDKTVSVQMKVYCYGAPSGFPVMLTLTPDEGQVSVRAHGPHARENAIATQAGILRILEPKRTSAAFFHLVPTEVAVSGCVMALFWWGVRSTSESTRAAMFATVAGYVALILFVYVIGTVLNPYIVFDNRRNEAMRSAWRYILGTVILGTLVVALRRAFLGF